MAWPTSIDGRRDHAPEPRLERLLALLLEWRGSDLHLQSGSCPRIRVHGRLRKVTGESALSDVETTRFAETLMPAQVRDRFAEGEEIDFSMQHDDLGRFRVHVFRQSGSIALSIRYVPTTIPSFEQLGLPETLRTLANELRGLILVTGPTGSGKTTTLAAMIDHINRTRECHVVTIEDPIEIMHRAELAEVSQREIGMDTQDYASAMRSAMRQDPDVILVGEMRDAETVSAAIHAAETGHLVLSTLHTTDAVETISRIVDFFPPHQQHQIRVSLASTLRGVIGQRLIPTAFVEGRVPALEIMVANGRVQQCILDPDRQADLIEIISQGDYYGMTTFDQSLARLCADRTVDLATAMIYATNPHDLQLLLHRTVDPTPLQPLAGVS